MKFSILTTVATFLALTSAAPYAAAAADDKAKDATLSVILADIKAHQSDYLGQIASGNTPPANLLSLVQQAQTYTNSAYTTLYSQVDMSQVSSYITTLPWYSSRLAPAISSATKA